MAMIVPSVTPYSADPHVFREQIERVSFAPRIQIDLMDGEFAPNKNTNPIQVWWPEGVVADIHLMYRHPAEHLETLISLRPHLIILHAEAEGDIAAMVQHIQRFSIKAGVALLADTTVESARDCIAIADHVMLFGGKLGHFGGKADLTLLDKVSAIREVRSDSEIGWDGGANQATVATIAAAGIDVINVGSAIQRSDNPQQAYEALEGVLRQ